MPPCNSRHLHRALSSTCSASSGGGARCNASWGAFVGLARPGVGEVRGNAGSGAYAIGVFRQGLVLYIAIAALVGGGCASPYHADRGALAGGLGGAGVGALIGNAVGHTGAGAAIGAGVGTLAGAAVGGALDDIEARNRAQIAAQMGRPVPAGLVTFDDVIAMTRAGVDEDLIVNHIQANGAARPPQASDLIMLQQHGVSKRVIAALQAPPAPPARYDPYIAPAPPGTPVIIEEHHYGPPWPYWPRPRPHIGIGFSYHRHARCR